MKRLLLLNCLFVLAICITANTILLKNIDEVNTANKNAKAGDIIIFAKFVTEKDNIIK